MHFRTCCRWAMCRQGELSLLGWLQGAGQVHMNLRKFHVLLSPAKTGLSGVYTDSRTDRGYLLNEQTQLAKSSKFQKPPSPTLHCTAKQMKNVPQKILPSQSHIADRSRLTAGRARVQHPRQAAQRLRDGLAVVEGGAAPLSQRPCGTHLLPHRPHQLLQPALVRLAAGCAPTDCRHRRTLLMGSVCMGSKFSAV